MPNEVYIQGITSTINIPNQMAANNEPFKKPI